MAFLQFTDNEKIFLCPTKTTYIADQKGKLVGLDSDPGDSKTIFIKASRGWVVIDLSGRDSLVNGLRVPDFKRIREGDRLSIRDKSARFIELTREVLQSDTEERCLYDHHPLRKGDTIIRCPGCGRVYHEDCWGCLDQCSVCFYQNPEFETEPQSKI